MTINKLVSMFEELHTYSEKKIVKFKALKKDNASLEVLYEELKTSHERLTVSHEKLKEAHDNLLSTTQHGAHIDVGISCDLLCDSATCHITHLKEQVAKLNKSLERCFKGKNTLDKILSEQQCILNKEELGFISKKGKKSSHRATHFVKSNGKYCFKCREVGHLVNDCPGGKPSKTCMFDSHYMLRKAYDGSIVARYVGFLYFVVNYRTGGSHWVLDSGCTQHMTGDGAMFTTFEVGGKEQEKVTFGDNSKGNDVTMATTDTTVAHTMDAQDDIKINSSKCWNPIRPPATLLTSNGRRICIRPPFWTRIRLIWTGKINNPWRVIYNSPKDRANNSLECLEWSLGFIRKGFRYGNLYLVDFNSSEANLKTCLVAKTSLGWLWHRRLAHVGMNQLSKLSKRDLVVDLKDVKFEKDKLCSTCQAGKQVACSHPTKIIMSTSRPFELLHMDLFGPTTYKSIGGNSHCLVIVDDYSRYTWVFFLHDKSIVAELFKKFAKRAQNEFSCTLVKIRSDNGSEFKNTNIKDYCDDLGIKHELSATYSPQQNGVVERKNRTLIEMARTILDEYGVSDSFWAKAINTACHATNRLYLHRLLKKTSYELIVGRKPNVAYFRVFGCKCYIYQKGVRLTKFQSRCYEGFLLGYASNSKAYRVYNKNKGIVEETVDVQFDETNGSQKGHENLDDVGDDGLMRAMKNMSAGDVKPIEMEDKPSTSNQDEPSTSATPSQAQVEVEEKAQDPPMPPRIHTPLSKDRPIDQVLGDITKGVQTRSRVASICKHYSFVSCLEPKHVDEALCDPDWMNAMHEELNNFARNKVWTLVERPRDHNVIGTKWVEQTRREWVGAEKQGKIGGTRFHTN
uniref:Retrotransposon protein, putative, Ty1-copia subclass n=1 Tax=Oryza sativa subsp. japonica TaxID=39947 RepID=Q2QT18_ORYSJ|nr:retrotransposon protein, putative, Ty1-copia subclass [Oryza sativa Japonica Group]